MKWAAYMLAILIGVLSMVPCSDLGDHPEGNAVQTHQHSSNLPSSHEEGIEMCSPFCLCACCKTNVTIHYPNILPTYIHAAAKPFAAFNDRMDSADLLPVWQPPRV